MKCAPSKGASLMVSFTCNICGRENTVETLRQEESSCGECGSNVRLRGLVHMLSIELFASSIPLPEFPRLRAIRGVGLSDQRSYAAPLAAKFDYTNTYYDREPRLDITEPHPDRHGSYDFILSSDVFEHIAVPVERAFEEACKLLKPHGVLCLTTPSSLEENTVEHYPDLHEYSIADLAGSLVLINRKRDGTLQIRDSLRFHGGVGTTLEMRLFSQRDLERKLLAAGFETVVFQGEPVPRFGIVFEGKWSLPLVARKRAFAFGKDATGQLLDQYAAMAADVASLRRQCLDAEAKLEIRGQQVDRLDAEQAERAAWVASVEREHRETVGRLAQLQTEFDQRSRWALDLKGELEAETHRAEELRAKLEQLQQILAQAARSKWMRLGKQFGVGPKLG
jgi:SAM-dependent methyltransferase